MSEMSTFPQKNKNNKQWFSQATGLVTPGATASTPSGPAFVQFIEWNAQTHTMSHDVVIYYGDISYKLLLFGLDQFIDWNKRFRNHNFAGIPFRPLLKSGLSSFIKEAYMPIYMINCFSLVRRGNVHHII